MSETILDLESRYAKLEDKRGREAHGLREEIRKLKNEHVAQVAAQPSVVSAIPTYESLAEKIIVSLVAAHGVSELGKSNLEDTLVNIGLAHMALRAASGESVEAARESERRGAAQGRAWADWLRGNRPTGGGFGLDKPGVAEVAPTAAPSEITHAPSEEALEKLQERQMKRAQQEAVDALASEKPDFTPVAAS